MLMWKMTILEKLTETRLMNFSMGVYVNVSIVCAWLRVCTYVDRFLFIFCYFSAVIRSSIFYSFFDNYALNKSVK